jgi:hypothetical protein
MPLSPLPSARVIRENGVKPTAGWGDELRTHALTPVWNGIRHALGLAGAFFPLVAVVALAVMLLWSAAMAGSP